MAPDDVIAEIHGFSEPGATPVPWSTGLEQVIAADTFWLSTVRPEGPPHVTPLIAVWHGEAIWFSTGPVAVAVMRNHIAPDFSAVAAVDDIITASPVTTWSSRPAAG